MANKEPIGPKKVAILGGGPSSCTAALALTSQPGWKERYDITIYQLGWRLGGKAATGRNQKYGQRIEEIATHMFPAVYYNFQKVVSSVYEELNRSSKYPFRTFYEAFATFDLLNRKPVDYSFLLQGIKQCFSIKYLLEKLLTKAYGARETINGYLKTNITTLLGDFDPKYLTNNPSVLRQKVKSLQGMIQLFSMVTPPKSETSEIVSVADIAIAVVIGILDDNLIENGYGVINHLDLRQWLKNHGANSKSLNSGYVKFHYDIMHGYLNGDIRKPDLEAGTALRLYLHSYFCFDSSPLYVQQGGSGDMIFAPIYELLKERGVKFKFFHKVEKLTLNRNNPQLVEEIRITKQVNIKGNEYDPLINVKGLPSWPNKPIHKEIDEEQASLMEENNIDLESFWTRWPKSV